VECGAREVRPCRISHELQKAHDGRLHLLRISDLSVTKCAGCGEIYFGNEADRQISAALRKHLRLLAPEEILAQRQTLGLRQKDLAESLGVAVETISRWEGGGLIQSRAMDNLLRIYFSLPQVRKALSTKGQTLLAGASGKNNRRPVPKTAVTRSKAVRGPSSTPLPGKRREGTSGKRALKAGAGKSVSVSR
jgi:putative zinc finger/helix-turn-helix YgiT family protein